MSKEYSEEKLHYIEDEFRRQRNPRVEEILDEKYILAKEMNQYLYDQTVRLYRLKE